MLINGLGALATGVTVLIVATAKFTEGAWVVVFLVPALVTLMAGVHRHYERVTRETAPVPDFLLTGPLRPPIVVVPIESWSSVAQKALRFALTISDDVEAVHVEAEGSAPLSDDWEKECGRLARAAGLPVPRLVRLESPYRLVIQPILDYVLAVERDHPDRTVAVVIPQLVERRWYHYFLHNQRGELLAALLLVKGDRRIVIINVPWYLESP
jgi:hypothetical protein